MKKKVDNKKLATIIFGVVCAVIIVVCIIIQLVLKNEDKKLEAEGEKFETLVVETPNGNTIETNYTYIDDRDFYFKVPVTFKRLDDETIAKKYSGNIPNIVFSNDETTINLVVNLTENEIKNEDIKDYLDFFEALSKEQGEVLDTKYYNVNDHNIGRIKLISDAEDGKIYNDMMFFSDDGKLVIIAFNCTETLQSEWSSVGDFILDSLFFKLEEEGN